MSKSGLSVRDLARELIFERPAGIRSAGKVRLADIGLGHHERVDYTAAPWRVLPRMLPPITSEDVFVDIGVGKGRVLCQAARYPFARCIGVEISPEMTEVARINVQRMRRRRARNVEVITADASNWAIPDDVTVIFMNCPFTGESFARLTANLVASLVRAPRQLRVIYLNPWEHDMLVATKRFRVVREWRVRLNGDRDSPTNFGRLYETI